MRMFWHIPVRIHTHPRIRLHRRQNQDNYLAYRTTNLVVLQSFFTDTSLSWRYPIGKSTIGRLAHIRHTVYMTNDTTRLAKDFTF